MFFKYVFLKIWLYSQENTYVGVKKIDSHYDLISFYLMILVMLGPSSPGQPERKQN